MNTLHRKINSYLISFLTFIFLSPLFGQETQTLDQEISGHNSITITSYIEEDVDNDGFLDVDEDIDDDGRQDIGENLIVDHNGNGVWDAEIEAVAPVAYVAPVAEVLGDDPSTPDTIETDFVLVAEVLEVLEVLEVVGVPADEFIDTNGNGSWDDSEFLVGSQTKVGQIETFIDDNKNGAYDLGEDFIDGNDTYDIGEEFIDALNGVYDEGEDFVDTNGVYDIGEAFIDGNDTYDIGEDFTDELNGVYDIGEAFVDAPSGTYEIGEPFVDLNEDGIWQPGELFTDTLNGVYDIGEEFTDALNGVYDLGEPFVDELNGTYDIGEAFVDNIGNGVYDEGEDFTDALNGEYDEGEVFTDLKNGVYDADQGETYTDAGNGVWDDEEPFVDGNGVYDEGEDFLDQNGTWDVGETLTLDSNDNGVWDDEIIEELGDDPSTTEIVETDFVLVVGVPADEFIDESGTGNGLWDAGEPFVDLLNGVYDIGESFTDTDGDGQWDAAETINEENGNGIYEPLLTSDFDADGNLDDINELTNPETFSLSDGDSIVDSVDEDRDGDGALDTLAEGQVERNEIASNDPEGNNIALDIVTSEDGLTHNGVDLIDSVELANELSSIGVSSDGIEGVIMEQEDGSIHIGENSLITNEVNGVQELYAEDANGNAIDINVTNGSDLLIDGNSVATESYADSADTAQSTALTTAFTDADTAQSTALTTAFTDADTAQSTALTTAFTDADTAQSTALTTAFTDADTVLDSKISNNSADIALNSADIALNRDGIAMAAAISHSTILPGKTQALDISNATFEGSSAMSINYSRKVREGVQINLSHASAGGSHINKVGVGIQW